MPTIYYFCLDAPQPSGGVKTLYRHVHLLNRIGFDAAIVHQKRGFRLDWHGYDVPVIWAEDRPPLTSADCLVIPEVMPEIMAQTAAFGGRRLVIALSWQPGYSRLRPGQSWRDFGIEEVITCSSVIQRWLKWSMGVDATLFQRCVDPEQYYFAPAEKEQRIAYMTRKDRSGEWLQGVLSQRDGDLKKFSWLALRNLTEKEYARALRGSQIFLPTTQQEGMHISVLEAMACGALVIGYSGVGGGEYMVGSGPTQNCVLVENGNLPELGIVLEQTLRVWSQNEGAFAPIIQNGLVTARSFQNPETEIESLRHIFG